VSVPGSGIVAAADLPNHRLYADVVAYASRDLGTLLAASERPQEAAEFLDEAVNAAARLHEADPRDSHPLDLYFGMLLPRAALAVTMDDGALASRLLSTAQELAQTDVALHAGSDVSRAYEQQISAVRVALESARSHD